ncbi:MAG: CxxxxCH/CxxCH domain-containing protein [Nitrospirae bacterium]|nr:CxxxxCH/CxxCH domain-containing protein [Nitrospirota bacterium]
MEKRRRTGVASGWMLMLAFVVSMFIPAVAHATKATNPGTVTCTQNGSAIDVVATFTIVNCAGGDTNLPQFYVEWDIDPDGGGAGVPDWTGTGYGNSGSYATDNTTPYNYTTPALTLGNSYAVRVTYQDLDGIGVTCGGATTQVVNGNNVQLGNNSTTTGSLSSPSQTMNSVDLEATYTNDDNNSNTAVFEYQHPVNGWTTISGPSVTRGTKTWSVSATGLDPGTSYNFRVTFSDGDTVSGTNPVTGSYSTMVFCSSTVTGCTDCHTMPPSAGDHEISAHKGAGARDDCAVCHYNYAAMTNVTSASRWLTGHSNLTMDIYTSNHVANKVFSAPYDKGIKGGYYKGYRNSSTLWEDKTPNANNVCAATYCHGAGDSPVWGVGTASCGSCHGVSTPPAGGKHGSHTNGYVGYKDSSNATTYNFGCYKCHDEGTVGHSSGPSSANQAAAVGFDNRTAPFNPSGSYTPGGSTAGTDGTFNWTNGTCASLYCHSDGKGGYTNPTWNGTLAANCLGCHKNNKASGGGNIMATGKHTEHVNNADANLATYGCVKCHNATVSADRTLSDKSKHVDGTPNVAFDTLNPSGSYSSPDCSTAYCHSTGQSTPSYQTPDWNTGAALTCDGCHGVEGVALSAGAPEYANASTSNRNTFNSHDKHALADADCVNCHGQTVDGAKAIVASSRHIDTFRNVSFAKGGTYNTTLKRCDNTDCHGTTEMRWGGSLPASCQSCHSDMGAGTNGSHGNTGKHDRHTNAYGYACEVCHATKNATGNTSHAGGDVSSKHAAQVFFNRSATVWTAIQYGGGGSSFKYLQMDSAFGLSGIAPIYKPATTASAQSDPISLNRKWTEGRCENVWCHSNANPMGGAMQYAQFANWSASEATTCTSCHGGPGTYAAVSLSAKHKMHAGTDRYSYACSECHNATVGSGNSPVTDLTKHVNAVKDVGFDGTNVSGSYTGPNCSTLYCHGDGNGGTGGAAWNGAATTCTSCHAYSALATSKHDEHLAGGNLASFRCGDCHKVTVQTNNTTINYALGKHVNSTKDVSFKAMGSYTGFYTASRTCRNSYCHSSGQATPSFRTAADWSGATAYGCASCHGADSAFLAPSGEPNYANVSTATRNAFNSHSSHVTASTDCARCHNTTVDASQAVLAGGKHLDTARDVSFAKGGTYNNTSKRCNNTDCHGTTQMRWGGRLPKNCQSCHSDMGSGTYANHSSTGKHGKHVATYGYACEVCHATKNASVNTSHAGGDVSSKHAAQVFFNTSATVWANVTYGGGGASLKYRQMDGAYGQNGIAPVYTPWTTTTALSDPLSPNRKYTQGRCDNIWCHSNAKPLGGVITYAKFANWSTGETATCTSCHGGAGTFANVTLSDAHKKHVGTDRYGYTCSECHNATVSAGNSPVTDYSKHVNAAKEVGFDGTNPAGTYTSPSCANLACHGNGNGGTGSYAWNGAATTCASCHNYTVGSGSPITTGAHGTHINQGNLGVSKCVDCHKLTVLNNNTTIQYSTGNHVNQVKTVSMKSFNSYTGFYTASNTCRNAYCHSSGQFVPAFVTTPVWASGSLTCDGCHGAEGATLVAGSPEYANVSTTNRNTFNGHAVSGHVGAATDCIKCHNSTVDAAGAIKAGSLHLDGSRNVSFQLGGSYDSTNKRCSNTDAGCHGTTTMRWGGSGTCSTCHQVTTAEDDDYTYGSLPKATVNFYEYTSVGHGKKGAYRYTGNTGADLACTSCHSMTTPHNAATNPFRLISSATIKPSQPNTLCASCHGTVGNHDFAHVAQGTWSWTPKCVDCHDPHGDNGGVTTTERNGAMVQKQVSYTASNTYGVPGTTEAVDFPANYARAKSLAAFNWSSFVVNTGQANKGICRVCHTQASTNYFTRTVSSSTHEIGSACITCHSHPAGFQPPACDSCHGNPPNTGDAKTDTQGAVGAHAKHVNRGMSCYDCHKSNQHNQSGVSSGYSGALTPGFVNMSVAYTFKFNGSLPNYNGTPGGWSTSKTCSNVNCHYGESKDWSCQ